MPTKTITIEAKMGAGFDVECTVGNHTVHIDQPAEMGGADAGPNPLQYLFLSLAGCVGSIGRIIANQKRLPLNGMTITVEGDIDTAGLLGQPTDSRIGFQGFTVTVDVDADMTDEEKMTFLKEVDARCPISDNLVLATPVAIKSKA